MAASINRKKIWVFLSIILIITPLFLSAQTTYTSKVSYIGFWNNNNSWVGGTSPPSNLSNDRIIISNNSTISKITDLVIQNNVQFDILTSGRLTIEGDFIIQNNLDLDIDGLLIIDGQLITQNGADITLTGNGFLQTNGTVSLDQNSNFVVDGSVDFNSDVSLGQNAIIQINSLGFVDIDGDLNIGDNAFVTVDGIMRVSGNVEFGNNADLVVNGLLLIDQNLSFLSAPDQFTGSGTVNIGGTSCAGWTGTGTCNDLLPVVLLYLKAEKFNNSVKLRWRTAAELNNDFFTIEKSTDGINYSTISHINGYGTTNLPQEYEYIDESPSFGINYYRLSQTDLDGTTEIFRPISIEYLNEDSNWMISPNPFSAGSKVRIIGNNLAPSSTVKIIVRDLNGKELGVKTLYSNTFGNISENLTIPFSSKGIYVLNIIDQSGSLRYKLIRD